MENPLDADTDCPDCGVTATVRGGVCDLCLADLGERRWSARRAAVAVVLDPSDLRFSDVVEELRAVVALARESDGGSPVAAAGIRAERLLGSLRTQFLRDLGLPRVGAAGAE
jgi:hypothetical protein